MLYLRRSDAETACPGAEAGSLKLNDGKGPERDMKSQDCKTVRLLIGCEYHEFIYLGD
jgi:hypothetical protein